MDGYLLAYQQFLIESHIVIRLTNERAPFLNMHDINDISFFGTSDYYHCCSIAYAWMVILCVIYFSFVSITSLNFFSFTITMKLIKVNTGNKIFCLILFRNLFLYMLFWITSLFDGRDIYISHRLSGNANYMVLIDQQSVEKRSLHLMDTVNVKKRWTTIYWCVYNS
jgi:hypothetical protein